MGQAQLNRYKQEGLYTPGVCMGHLALCALSCVFVDHPHIVYIHLYRPQTNAPGHNVGPNDATIVWALGISLIILFFSFLFQLTNVLFCSF